MALSNVIARLQVHADTAMGGFNPTYPPEDAAVGKYSLCYEQQGTYHFMGLGFADDLATLIMEFHFPRFHLPLDVAGAVSTRETFLEALRDDPTLNGTCSSIQGTISWKFGYLDTGQADEDGAPIQDLGYQFLVTVKLLST